MASYRNKRGIFGLRDVSKRQRFGAWTLKNEVWLPPSSFISAHPFGYIAGSTSSETSIDRIDYSNDTATALLRGSFPTSNKMISGAASSSNNFGYFAGGRKYPGGSSASTINRIDYTNDTATTSLRGPLTAATRYFGGTGNINFGYFALGDVGPNSSAVDRVDYSNDTATASPKGPLSEERGGMGAAGNADFGYFGGGSTPAEVSTVDRIDYSNDTVTAPAKGPLSVARFRVNATGNSDFGYFGGGFSLSLPGYYSTVDRIDYSSDTGTTPAKGPMSTAKGYYGATGNASFGYFGGGYTGSELSTVDRIDYSSDTGTASVRGPLSSSRFGLEGFSAQANAITVGILNPASAVRENIIPQGTDFGYMIGGAVSGSNKSKIERIDYSNDTAQASLKGPLSGNRKDQGATSSASFGYVTGGPAVVDRIDYANDTAATAPKGPLSAAKYRLSATGNADFGYFGGGQPTNSTVERLDYSNDTATAVAKGPLSVAREQLAATGNQSFGYFGGGFPPTTSVIDRIDYSNDTATASPKGPLSSGKRQISATGNADFGYFTKGGGDPVDRVDYSNDTATALQKGSVTNGQDSGSASSTTHGYFGGGNPGLSSVGRLDYSNDTAASVEKGPLTAGTRYLCGTSSRENANPLKAPGILELAKAFAPFSILDPPAPTGFDTGYFTGGQQPANSPSFPTSLVYSSIARIDYSNDTTTVPARGPLTGIRERHAGTGSSNFGYHGSGAPFQPSTSGYLTTIERIDYSNDTATASLKGQLTVSRFALSATGNQSFGYFGGGRNGPFSSIERIDYSNDTANASPKGPLAAGRYSMGATGNQSFGYFGGGQGSSGRATTVDRVDYSNDTATASPKGPLSLKRRSHGSTGNSDFGYSGGGYNTIPGGNNWISIVDRIDYSNDTATASPKGNLTRTRGSGCATGDSSSGYFGGGEGNNDENLSSLDRVDYSNDTVTAVDKGPLSYSLRDSSASSSRANANPTTIDLGPTSSVGTDFGYFGGGNTPIHTTSVDRIDYNNDTATASPKGPLSVPRSNFGATGNADFGYIGAGSGVSGVVYSSVDRIDYNNDTATAVVKGPLSLARLWLAATGNSDFGYFASGTGNPPNYSTVDRIDYTNDTATAVAKGPLSTAKNGSGASGNQNFGYFAGGGTPGIISTVDRIDYSNDTATASPKGPLSSAKSSAGATSNADFGYYAGGGNPASQAFVSKVDRVDYSNDTVTASPKGPLSNARYVMAATGNSSFGYFGGGYNPFLSPARKSTVDRIDYSNDTATASPKGPLSTAKAGLGASSSRANANPTEISNITHYAAGTPATSHFGYFAGGGPGPTTTITTVDRIDYTNDTTTLVKGPLTVAIERFAQTSSGTHGYFSGGQFFPDSPNHVKSSVERINYLNDIVTTSIKGPLTIERNAPGGVGNKDFGYVAGGGTPASPFILSSIDRIDYSNDTATATVKGQLTSTRGSFSGTGNQNFGYFGGGSSGSKVDRIDYSNDTATATVKGTLTVNTSFNAAAGNADFGYFSGGPAPAPDYAISTVDRVDYSNDTATASPKGPLSVKRYAPTATGTLSFGYFGGGNRVLPSPGPLSSVDRVDYSNDTATASPKGDLSAARLYLGATGARENGFVPLGPAIIPNTTTQNFPATVFGYYMGGRSYPSPTYSTVQRINYTNDTVTLSQRGPLTILRDDNFGVSSTTHGYTGGESASNNSTVDRIDYSNDTATATPVGNLASGYHGYALGGVGNLNYGYIAGGFHIGGSPPSISTISRIDYSNDTATAPAIATLSNFRMMGDSASNLNYGYFIGGRPQGSPSVSTVDRFDFSSDTTNASPHTQLPHSGATDENLAATGNGNFAYIYPSSPSFTNGALQKIDYSNDTLSPVPTVQASQFNPAQGPSSSRAKKRATGNDNFAYFAGGGIPAPTTTVVRLDYANDTTAAVEKGSLLQTTYGGGMTSAAEHGLPQ